MVIIEPLRGIVLRDPSASPGMTESHGYSDKRVNMRPSFRAVEPPRGWWR